MQPGRGCKATMQTHYQFSIKTLLSRQTLGVAFALTTIGHFTTICHFTTTIGHFTTTIGHFTTTIGHFTTPIGHFTSLRPRPLKGSRKGSQWPVTSMWALRNALGFARRQKIWHMQLCQWLEQTQACSGGIKRGVKGSAESGGALAPEPPRASRHQPESIRTVIFGKFTFFPFFFGMSQGSTQLRVPRAPSPLALGSE